jgi:hypothetical protein
MSRVTKQPDRGGYPVFGRVSLSRPLCARTSGTLAAAVMGEGVQALLSNEESGATDPRYAAPICIHQKLMASTADGQAAHPGSRRAQREPT